MKILPGLLALLISAAALPAAAENPVKGDYLVVSNLTVQDASNLQAGAPYMAMLDMRTTSEIGVGLQQMCFMWDKEGPFCYKDFQKVKGKDGGEHPVMQLQTGRAGTYVLTAYMTYTVDSKLYYAAPVAIKITVH